MDKKGGFQVLSALFLMIILVSPYLNGDFESKQVSAQTSAVTCPSPLLGYHSDNYQSFQKTGFKLNAYVGSSLGSKLYGENFIHIGSPIQLNITTNSLPAGLSIGELKVDYNNTWRYSVEGTMNTPGTYTIVFTATAIGMDCGSDTSTLTLTVNPGEVACKLSADPWVKVGDSANIFWTINSDESISNGYITPPLQGSPNFKATGSGKSQSLSSDTAFTLNLTTNGGATASCTLKVPVGVTQTSGLVTSVKSVFTLPTVGTTASQQYLQGVIPWGDKFVYTGQKYLSNPYGGLWVVNQDGTNLIAREPHMDADAEYRSIAQHGNAHGNGIFADWNGGSFLRENSSWWSCSGFECSTTGAGAVKAVTYQSSGNNIYISAKTPRDENNTGFLVFKGKALNTRSGTLMSLPDLQVIRNNTSIPPGIGYGFGFYDFAISRGNGIAYSVSETGVFNQVKNLIPNRPTGAHSLTTRYAFDFSVTPARLAVYSHNAVGGLWMNYLDRKISIYKISGNNLVLDKEYKFKDCNLAENKWTCSDLPPIYTEFGVWGDYFIFPGSGGFDVYKGMQKVSAVETSIRRIYGDTLNAAPEHIAINKNGYIALTFNQSMESFIYKINANAPISPTDPTNPGGPPGPVLGSAACALKYPTNIQLRNLCEQIEALKKLACSISPSITFCSQL